MLDFQEEIAQYKPVLLMEEVETAVNSETRDIMYLLQYIVKQIPEKNREE